MAGGKADEGVESGFRLILDQLDKDATGAFGVDEGDESLVCAEARRLVDESHAALFELGERGLQVIDTVGEVVDTGASSVEESSDWRGG